MRSPRRSDERGCIERSAGRNSCVPSCDQRVELERGPLSQIAPMLLVKGVRLSRAKTMQAHYELPLRIELAARPTAVGSLIGSDAVDVQVADPVEHVLPEAMVGRFLRQGQLEKSQVLELLQQACVEGDRVEPAGNIGRVAGPILASRLVQLDDAQLRVPAFLHGL